jgi:folate-binding protein YgfZ
MLGRLGRYKVRVAADLELLSWQALLLRGPAARPAASEVAAEISLEVDHPGFSGCDLLGPAVSCPAGVARGDPAGYEAARIEAGVPVMGRELTAKTIPQEAGLVPRAVSLTKGCYTGQELVARLDARGNRVARRLVGFTVTSGTPAAGDTVVVAGSVVGALTSVAYSPRTLGYVALGYLGRAVATPAPVEIVHEGSPCGALATELPLWEGEGAPAR